MRIGAGFPTLDLGGDPAVIRHWAESVEALGFDHILAYEHIVGFNGQNHVSAFGPLDAHSCFDEPLVLLGFLAAVTRRVGLATGVLVLPQRQTALVAKQAAQVDALSGGRLRLGIGVGWVPEEFALLRENYRDRGRRAEEQIAVLRALWTEQPAAFQGRWHQFEQAGISPLPVQRPIPIWIGSHSEAGLRRLGRWADGWLPVARSAEGVERLKGLWQTIREAAEAAGRDPAAIGIDGQVVFNWVPEHGWREYASAWQSFGATHLTVTTMGLAATSVDDHLAALAYVRDELITAGVVEPATGKQS
ncbi:MAG TPA: LLM class F420-dependent oxidoreductase [Thermomicrobiaceae bacterium]|nr:LLM class F420-dependent oxidoreductase [Thermomicrobiaceae bacterium]